MATGLHQNIIQHPRNSTWCWAEPNNWSFLGNYGSASLTNDALLDAPPEVLLVLAFPGENADVGLGQGRRNLVLTKRLNNCFCSTRWIGLAPLGLCQLTLGSIENKFLGTSRTKPRAAE